MNLDSTSIIIAILVAVLSGAGTALISGIKEEKREKTRQHERNQDMLKMDLKDLKIQLYEVEKQLTEWKDKYYDAIQQLIGVKAELEETLIKLSLIDMDFHTKED